MGIKLGFCALSLCTASLIPVIQVFYCWLPHLVLSSGEKEWTVCEPRLQMVGASTKGVWS